MKESAPNAKNKVFLPAFGFGLGWFAYLVNGYSPRNVCHFDIFHTMFAGRLNLNDNKT